VQGKRLPTIEGFARIEMTEDVISSCRLSESRFVLGTISGNLLIYEADTPLGRAELESAIISVIASGENVIAASSTGQIQAFHGQPLWVTEVESGIENLAPLGDAICFCDASGMLVVISPEGETLSSQSHGDITQLTGSDDGSSIAIAMTDGTLRICSKSGEILQESSADSDDVETISQICFRPDGVLLVCRDSLGMTLDDRPENRLECWHSVRGLLHTNELPASASSILATDTGSIVGCQNGALLRFNIGEEVEELATVDNSISSIIEWGDDVIIGTWFHTLRISSDGSIIWSHEHEGLVSQILPISPDLIAVIGRSPSGKSPASVVLLDPDSEPIVPEVESFDYEFSQSDSSEFAGGLSDEEIAQAGAPPEVSIETEELMDALGEELEFVSEEEVVSEADLLQDLSASARAINLPPIADAGEDITISADEDGTATILLDGSRSYDPDGKIENYAWQDFRGNVIGDSAQVRVRLQLGTHPFELTVVDDKGAATKAMVTVRIQ
tara:strand:+ start:4116 stop:5624 length:1509 start_codon:yes stop_codon:yes gene_type:complete